MFRPRVFQFIASFAILAAFAPSSFACGGLYTWFDRVFGYQSMFYMPLGSSLSSTLGDLSGHVILGSETVDDFRGCEVGKIVQFRSGSYVTCDDYGYEYASYGTEVLIVARPSASGKDHVVCNFHCKMIVTGFLDNDVFDVLCADYVAAKFGVVSIVPPVESPTNPPGDVPEDPLAWLRDYIEMLRGRTNITSAELAWLRDYIETLRGRTGITSADLASLRAQVEELSGRADITTPSDLGAAPPGGVYSDLTPTEIDESIYEDDDE